MPWFVNLDGMRGGVDVPSEKVSSYLPCDSQEEYSKLLKDAAVEVIIEEHGEEALSDVPWYPEEYVPLDEREKKD
jgi:hypothetical protein